MNWHSSRGKGIRKSPVGKGEALDDHLTATSGETLEPWLGTNERRKPFEHIALMLISYSFDDFQSDNYAFVIRAPRRKYPSSVNFSPQRQQ